MSKYSRLAPESTTEKSFTGKLIGHRDGFGFLRPDAGGDDVFISAKEMLKAMHGDRVMAKVIGTDKRGRPEAMILEVLDHATRRLVGRLVHERGIVLVVPEDQRIKHDVVIPAGETAGAAPGEVVMVEIIDPPTRYTPPLGRVIEVLGGIDDPGMEVEIAVRKFDVPHEFSPDTEAAAERLPSAVRTVDVKGRVDLRDVDFVTIDGEDARDFDDAVFAQKQGRSGWRLLVAIADVSHYVRPNEPLDRDAFERATSVYFPRRVIPMLPEKLSNGLCSLNPDVERLVLVCDMVVSPEGMVKAYQFYEGVIQSSARLTYDDAWAALSHPEGAEARRLGPVMPTLEALQSVYRLLLAQRQERGAIDLETIETMMKTDSMGRIVKILPRIRNEAHRLIEECMLAANTSAADFLLRSEQPGLFRIHEGPTPERLKTLREFLKTQGLRLGGEEDPSPGDYAALAREIRQRPDARLLQTLLLRSMQQAIYSPDNVGHFGLAYESYTHFTSPIRRYPDLMVHRIIKARLKGKAYKPHLGQGNDPVERWRIIGEHCSAAERRADEASRDVEAWLKCQFMKDRVGEQLPGTITGVAPFGLFVTLDSLYVEGLIHVSELGAEYFQHNEASHELRGERTGRRFRLYDAVQVQVSRVDLDARRIEFRLLPGQVRTTAARKSPARTEPSLDDADDLHDEGQEATLDLPVWLAEALAQEGVKPPGERATEPGSRKPRGSSAGAATRKPRATAAATAAKPAKPARSSTARPKSKAARRRKGS